MFKLLSTLTVVVALGTLQGSSVAYTYDSLNRLTRVTYPDGTTIAYTYDPAGNRLSQVISNTNTGNQPPAAAGVTPGSATASSQTWAFTFSDPRSWQDLDVVNILINNVLDGRQACYLAYSRALNVLYLVNDSGTALLPGLVLNGSGSVANNQCTVNAAGLSASGNGNTLTLTLNMSFGVGFTGNKVVYLAARDVAQGNSGWQALGTWGMPGSSASGLSVGGVNPVRSSGSTQTYTLTFTDTNGWQDIAVANILVNSAIDGRRACYLAFVPSGGSLLLVDDAGDAGGPYAGMSLPGSGSVSNSQCAINGAGSSVVSSGSTLTLTLPITFSHSFAGNQVFYLATRSNTANSDWQAVGSVSVP